MKLTREFFLPKDSTPLADEHSDAIAYLYTAPNGKPAAAMFYGKQSKPIWRFYFNTDAARSERIEGAFRDRRLVQDAKKARKSEEKSWRHGFEPGDIFKSEWGYDQTNVDYFEVISTTEKMLTVCKIEGASSQEEGFMTARCVPAPGQFKGEPFKVLAQKNYDGNGPKDGHFKVASYATARYLRPTEIVAGVKVYPASTYSWYA